MPLEASLGGPGATLAGLVVIEAVVLLILGLAHVLYVPLRKSVAAVLIGLALYGVCRTVWWVLLIVLNDSPADFVFNRLAWLCFTITFLLLLFSWMEMVHAKYPPPSDRFLPGIKWTLIILAVTMSLFVLILIIVWAVTSSSAAVREGNVAYEINIIFMVAVQALLSLGFLAYGSVMLYRIGASSSTLSDVDARRNEHHRSTLRKIVLVMSVFSICFLVRVVMFLFRPITGLYFPKPVFYIFAYMLPETVPAIVQMFVIIWTSETKRKSLMERKRRFDAEDGEEVSGPFVSNEPLLGHGTNGDSGDDDDDDGDSYDLASKSRTSGVGLNYSDLGSQVDTEEVPAIDYSRMGVPSDIRE